MQLHLSTWIEVEDYLSKSKGIVIPIGSTEQHGPNGIIGTDAVCPEFIAKTAADEAGFMVGPTFSVGMAQHHLDFPGSMTLRPSTMIAALQDWIESLARSGFEKIYFLNGHGGNVTTLNAAFCEYYANWSLAGEPCPISLRQKNWWELNTVGDVCARLFPVGEGMHATASEVSVTQFAYPDFVKTVEMKPKIAPVAGFRDAKDYRQNFPDGRIGSDPTQASVDAGRQIVEAASAALIKDVSGFFAD